MINRLLLLFFALLINLWIYGQDSINRTNASGRKQGVWRKVDKDGHKLYEGQFKDGLPCGMFRYYYPDGKLKTVSVLSDAGNTARTVSYAGNGRKIAEGNYRNEKKDSIWIYYSDYDGVLLSEESYASGLKNGSSKTFYSSGNVAELIIYIGGRKNGEWIQYYDDGKLKFKGGYLNDEKEGAFTAYYPSGKINISGSYKTGHKDGKWTIYEEDGKIINSDNFSEGALIKEQQK